jgi:hypothetical protein
MDFDTIMGMLAMIASLLQNGPVNQVPAIKSASPQELHEICQYPCQAAYVRPVIYLSESLDLTRAFDQGIVFHELVHHYQEIKSRYSEYSECHRWNARETEAYDLQNIWYEENYTAHHVRGTMRKCS